MKDDPNVIRCPECGTVMRYHRGVIPLIYLMRKELPRLDCPDCGKVFEADPYEAGGGILVEVTE